MRLIYYLLSIIVQIDLVFHPSVWTPGKELHSSTFVLHSTFSLEQFWLSNRGAAAHTGDGNSVTHECTQERAKAVLFWEERLKILLSMMWKFDVKQVLILAFWQKSSFIEVHKGNTMQVPMLPGMLKYDCISYHYRGIFFLKSSQV